MGFAGQGNGGFKALRSLSCRVPHSQYPQCLAEALFYLKSDHGPLEKVLQRGRRAVNFSLIAEQWQRIGQFCAAFPATGRSRRFGEGHAEPGSDHIQGDFQRFLGCHS